MKPHYRRLQEVVEQDLNKKMVLISGPRQCGKTTLAQAILKKWGGTYYNWDVDQHRRLLRQGRLRHDATLWVFDELHKYRRWRNWLKGIFDLHRQKHRILVTGSAKLHVYHRGGDSLQGRYFFHRLHPFTLSEILGLERFDAILDELPQIARSVPKNAPKVLNDLLSLGGYPEPFLSGSPREADRWRSMYRNQLIREEIRDLERVYDLDLLEMLYDRLPSLVGSVLSINSLREDLDVAFGSVKKWLAIFENLYVCFRIAPFGPPKIKAVKKEQKLYLWDWARVENAAARLENLVAFHLLRFKHWCEDVLGEKIDLRYFRTVYGHEVDFVLLRKNKPWIAIEVKEKEEKLDKNLKYLLERVRFPHAFQIFLNSEQDWQPQGINNCMIRILPAAKFLAQLP